MPENNNAERFLNAYSTIEHEMERILDLKDHRRFFELVDKSSRVNPVIERYRFDLREYSELRNAIVHDRSGGEIIAVPTSEVVDKIERIAALLVEPPKVAPLFLKEVLTLAGNCPVSRAVREFSKMSYTQAPVYVNGKLIGLLTSNMIVKWMGICLISNQEEVNLHETSLTDVIKKAGHENDYQFVSVNQSLFDLPDLFYHWQQQGRKLEAVLITQNGDPAEPLLGIITNRDLPAVHREIDQSSAVAEKGKA
jgi:predicted transcriptional regulator